jgi:hydrogenase-4 component B
LHGTTGSMKLSMSIYASVLALTGGLAAACFVKAFGIIFLGSPRSEKAKEAKEASSSMVYVTVSMSALALAFGLFAVPVTRALVQVSEQVTGQSLGGFNFTLNNLILTPQYGKTISLAPPLIALLLVFAAVMAFTFMRVFLPFRKTSAGPTWACGYYNLGTRTQYSATGFSKPFRIALSFFYRPYRKTTETKESMYHIQSRKYETSITPVFKQYIYKTIIKRAFGTANILTKLQSGSIHFYLAYIFIAIVFLLIFRNSF